MDVADAQAFGSSLEGSQLQKPHAVFWRRSFAFFIDIILLGFICFLFSLAAKDTLILMGEWSRLVGFLICAIYFVPLDSHLGDGQTIGKRILKVKLVNGAGKFVDPQIAFFRLLVISPVFFLDGNFSDLNQLFTSQIIGFILLGTAIGIVYFSIFNRKTGQSLQDIPFKTFVVKADSEFASNEKTSKKHYYIFSFLLILLCSSLIFLFLFISKHPSFKILKQVYAAVNFEEVKSASVTVGKNFSPNHETDFLSINLFVSKKPSSPEKLAEKAAAAVLKNYPNINSKDVIVISEYYGFDLGIYHQYNYMKYVKSPKEWQAQLNRVE